MRVAHSQQVRFTPSCPNLLKRFHVPKKFVAVFIHGCVHALDGALLAILAVANIERLEAASVATLELRGIGDLPADWRHLLLMPRAEAGAGWRGERRTRVDTASLAFTGRLLARPGFAFGS